MNHDYDFFTPHHRRIRFYKNNEAPSVIGGPLVDLYQTEVEALKHDEVLARPVDFFDFETPSLVRCNGSSTAVPKIKARVQRFMGCNC